jgi:hypothetical protein
LSRQKTEPPRSASFLALVGSLLALGVPFDALRSSAVTSTLRIVMLATFAVLGAVVLFRRPTRLLTRSFLGLMFSLALFAVAHPAVFGTLGLALTVLGGLATGYLSSLTPKWYPLLPLLLILVLAVEIYLGSNFYTDLWPAERAFFPSSNFRAHGTFGHPLPTSAVGLGMAVAILVAGYGKRWSWGALTGVWLTIGILLTATGSRSGLLLIPVSLGLVAARLKMPRLWVHLGAATYAFTVLLLSILVIFGHRSGGDLPRVLSFEGVRQTESFTVRSGALDPLTERSCPLECFILGSGNRALGEQLRAGRSLNEVATVDNAFVTLLYDFGLIGALAAATTLGFLGRSLRRSQPDLCRAAAAGGLAIFLFAFVFDIFYWTGPLFLLMFFVGLANASTRMSSEREVGVR